MNKPATLFTLAATLLTFASGCTGHAIKQVGTNSEQVCSTPLQFEVVTPRVMLVIDKSQSMAENEWDDGGETMSRWASLVDVVDSMVAEQDDIVEFGATFFPALHAAEGSCQVANGPNADVALYNGQAIMSVMPDRDGSDVKGGTPAHDGVQVALEHLRELDDSQPKVMVLVTDGAANCSDENDSEYDYDFRLNELVGSAYADEGIPTYVVGIDILNELDDDSTYSSGVNPFKQLEDVAERGGRAREGDSAKFYDVTSADALQGALEDISGGFGCELSLDAEPQDRDEVLIYVDDQPESRRDNCDEDGFRWVDEDSPSIELCGATCEAFLASGDLSVAYTCGSDDSE